MARSQDPNSAGSQFYLCLGAQPMLDSGYTVFGQTIEGMDVIAQLRVGDVIELAPLHITIVEANDYRVDMVRIVKEQSAHDEDE